MIRVDSYAWVPKGLLDPDKIKRLRRELTITPKAYGDDVPEPLELYRETFTHVGVPRAFFLRGDRFDPSHETEWNVTDGGKWPGDLKFKGDLRPTQQAGWDAVEKAFGEGQVGGLVQAVPGWGKCLKVGTDVLLWDGTVTKVEYLVPGDRLMGPDSKPREVLSTCTGIGPLYEIKPTKGDPWCCNDAHILTLVHSGTDEVRDVPLQEWLGWTAAMKGRWKQFAPSEGVEFPVNGRGPLPIEPYWLGLWVGDGDKVLRDGSLARVCVSKPDAEVEMACRDIALDYGLRVRTEVADGRCPRHHIVGEAGKPNALLDRLRTTLGVGLQIPRCYLTASRENRLQFLAGVLDTDGYNKGGCYEIVQKRGDYASDILFVARSLGFKAVVKPKVVNGEIYWRMGISGRCDEIPVRIPRKQCKPRKQIKVATRTGISVRSLGEGEYAGFTLDGDGRFLLGDFVVTHNTVWAANAIANLKRPTLVVVHKEFLMNQWKKRLTAFLPGVKIGIAQQKKCDYEGKHVVLGMVHTLGAKPYPKEFLEHFGLLILDEVHRIGAATWSPVPGRFPARYRIGLTATPRRKDGCEDVFKHHIGSVLYKSKERRLIPKIRRVHTNFELPPGRFNPALVSPALVEKFLCNHKLRNTVIAQQVCLAAKAGRKIIVVSDRLAHLDELRSKVLKQWDGDKKLTTDYYVGGRKEKELEAAEKVQVLFATKQYITEGLDITALDTMVLACQISDIEQLVGRILRIHPDKKEPIVVDFRDDRVALFRKRGQKRERQYRDLFAPD